MKTTGHPPEPARLLEAAQNADPNLRRLATLVRSALPIPARAVAARHLVRWRIRATLDTRRPSRRILRPAIVVALIFATGAVLGATIERVVLHQRRAALVAPRAAPVAPRAAPVFRAPAAPPADAPSIAPAAGTAHLPPPPRRRPPARKLAVRPVRTAPAPMPSLPMSPPPAASPVEAAPTAVEPIALSPPAAPSTPPAPSPPRAPSAPAAATPPPPPVATPRDEQTLFAAALDKLRADRNAAAALPLLDELRARFPAGLLAPEAATLRAEALVQLGRPREALGALDTPALAALPRTAADHVLRGELHAALREWPAAQSAFDAVLASGMFAVGADAPFVERALWGRAVARRRLGDIAGARVDLEDYLRRFPGGRFARAAARALGTNRREGGNR